MERSKVNTTQARLEVAQMINGIVCERTRNVLRAIIFHNDVNWSEAIEVIEYYNSIDNKKYDIHCNQLNETVHSRVSWRDVREFAFQLACDRANPCDDEMNSLTLECIEHARKGLESFTDNSVREFLELYRYEVIESE